MEEVVKLLNDAKQKAAEGGSQGPHSQQLAEKIDQAIRAAQQVQQGSTQGSSR